MNRELARSDARETVLQHLEHKTGDDVELALRAQFGPLASTGRRGTLDDLKQSSTPTWSLT